MKIGANLLTHAPSGPDGDLVTAANAVAARSLLESDIMEHDLHLYIVDNDSNNPVYDTWQRRLSLLYRKQVTFIPTGKSLPFSRARNAGYDAMSYQDPAWDLFLELDSDNVFPTRWFAPLLESLEEHPEAGIFSPGVIISNQWKTPAPTLAVDYKTMSYAVILEALNVAAASARSLYRGRVGEVRHPPVLARSGCLREIGLYDPEFRGGGWEDWDQILRVGDTTDWKVRTFLSSFVFHWMSWERGLLRQWQGAGNSQSEVWNRSYCAQKWPDLWTVYRDYNRSKTLLYQPPEGEAR